MCKVAFLLISPIVVFHHCPELPSPLSITRFYILFEQTINIIESFAFSPWLNVYIILMAWYRGTLVFLGWYQAICGFGTKPVPFYISSVLLLFFVLFCKFSFSIFNFVTSSDLYVLEYRFLFWYM